MELDAGAAVSVISDVMRKNLFPNAKIHSSSILLKTCTEEPIQLIGHLHVRAQYGDQVAKTGLSGCRWRWPEPFGRNWLKYLRLNWSEIATVQPLQPEGLNVLLKRHALLFGDRLGTVEAF